MKIKLVAIGKKMPTWIVNGYQEYAKRFPTHLPLQLIEIPLAPRENNADIKKLITQEGNALLHAISAQDYVIALDIKGQAWSTAELAQKLQQWQYIGQDIIMLIGGPDGLANACLQRANIHWSLSRLTLPHPLVRVIVAEQLYRAWTILKGHPYHRT